MVNKPSLQILPLLGRHLWRRYCALDAKKSMHVAESVSRQPTLTLNNRKKKVALLVGYNGQGYNSFQIKPGNRSIEDQLLMALQKGGFASEEECQNSESVFLHCGAKTGKDISAVKQTVSLLLSTDNNVEERLNSHLPPEIRVLGIRPLAAEIDSALIRDPDFCTYGYILPTFALSPFGLESKSFRASPQLIDRFREILGLFEGTKNLHNFLLRSKFENPDSERSIKKFECLEPFELGNQQYVECQVTSKIFKKDQIRLMVAFAFAIVKGIVKQNLVEKAFTQTKLDVLKAPEGGLFLQELHYHSYNEKFCKDGALEKLCWEQEEETIQSFKNDHIIPNIVNRVKDISYMKWIKDLPMHTFFKK
ncbi:Hypothetical predicted protein [Cloeon dipterum]|uniref:Pseudouridine synthase I TruA alpha/beta domain-containing protein n=1 Tax=Cloeon dipterum TaxID=197152 RepID=A0A8S1BSZ5_9INSE|nr:Hypothetical predicted protein [Cloeon dipterum]